MDTHDFDEKSLANLFNDFLTAASATEGSGILAPEISSRFLGFDTSDEPIRFRLNSDGLNLNHKIVLEKLFQNAVIPQTQRFSQKPFALHFQRVIQPSPQDKANPTISLDKMNLESSTVKPFGIKIKRRVIPGVKNIVAVASGKGGVGKSTVSSYLASAIQARGIRTGLLDADIYGPSAPQLFGVRGPLEVNEDRRIMPVVTQKGLQLVSFGFMSDAFNPVLWRGPMLSKALDQLCFETQWDQVDVLVVDLPPGTGDIPISLAESLYLNGVIIVTTPQELAIMDAHKAVSMFESLEVDLFGVVENMALHECSNCGHKSAIFGDGAKKFAKQRQLEYLTRLPLDQRLSESEIQLDRLHLFDELVDVVLRELKLKPSLRIIA